MKLILGSASAKRKILLEQAGLHIDAVMIPDVDEKAVRTPDHTELVRKLARAKCTALLPSITEPSFLITADTVLFRGTDLYEKPISEEDERAMLKSYDGTSVFGFVSGITVTNTATGETCEAVEDGEFRMGPFTDEFIEEWIKKGEYTQYAGGFTYMDPSFAQSYKHIRGGEDTLMGIPVELTKKFLVELGWNPQ